MHEYEDLVKRLRTAAQWADMGLVIVPRLCMDAAKAIEELSAKLDGLQFFEENITKLPNCNTCLKRPVLRGAWKVYNNTYVCSVCGRPVSFWKSDFCPNCGADMRGAKDA